MSGDARHTVRVDVHVLAIRDGKDGPEVLLSRRAGDVYATGLWHAPSGHLELETVVTAVVRETLEETGLVVDPADVRAAVTVHHRPPSGRPRVGFFFEVRRWQGTPRIMEPDKCDALGWFPFGALPEPMVAYCRAGLDAYVSGAPVALHFQDPDDPVAHDPHRDRLRLVPGAGSEGGSPGPGAAVRDFAERAVGRVAGWEDASWARENSRVWRVRGASGGEWFVKVHQNARFHRREVAALREWVPGLGGAGPRLVASDPGLHAIVVTAVPGRSLHGALPAGAEEGALFRAIGALLARVHASPVADPGADAAPVTAGSADATPARAAPAGPYDRMERFLDTARPLLAPGDEERVRSAVAAALKVPPLARLVTHGDLQLRNLLLAEDGTLRVIDFERSEPQPRVRDFVRILDCFDGRPDLADSFLVGYGRPLSDDERTHLIASTALDAVSGIAFGTRTGDPELVERGHRTLARLRAGTLWPRSDAPGDRNGPDLPARTPGPDQTPHTDRTPHTDHIARPRHPDTHQGGFPR
ncbi:phosphotransferase [Streptomyces sp. NPDC059491]|uniref:phosphotransferase n=1 Tax=Streptomyces sp. NPDC059491 TaxID=3346850 RepID=UPI0036788C48